MDLAAHCVYAMWALEKTDPQVLKLTHPKGVARTAGELYRLGEEIVTKRRTGPVAQRILVYATADRLEA